MYIVLIDNEVCPDAFTSLIGVSKYVKLSYPRIMRNKHKVFIKDGQVIKIRKVSLIKIKGRGKFKA